jgi:hypothetical protein
MLSRNVLPIGITMFIMGAVVGYGFYLFYPVTDISSEDQELMAVIQEFRTYMLCIPPSHEELAINENTWLHYNFDSEGGLTMIEIETSQNPDSPAWGYLPKGHPGMEFEHWALHVWLVDPNSVCLNLDSLISELQGRGLDVSIVDDIEQPFFSVRGKVLDVNGGILQVFPYDDPHSAANEAAKISEDGYTVGNTKVTWVHTPHFYQNGNLIIVYLGESEEHIRIFEEVIGFQFAGG